MFLLTDKPVMFPSTTLLGSSGGPVVDTRIDMPVGGRVYVDRIEAGEIARHFGFETPEAAQRRDARIRDLEQQLADTQARLRRVGVIVNDVVGEGLVGV